jgi:hypothetical protein
MDAMPKHLSICAAFLAFGTGSLNAQQQEAVLQKMEVPGAGFDIVLAMPKSPAGATYNLGSSPEALIIHLIGEELALPFEAEENMLKTLEFLQMPACAFHAENKDRTIRKPVAVYIIPKGE